MPTCTLSKWLAGIAKSGFNETGLPWVNPSPNMRNAKEALLYPGLAMLEYSTNYSVGRGTGTPFELIGADWIKGRELADYLNARDIPGVRADPTTFTPASSHFEGKTIPGVRFTVTNHDVFSSSRLGLEVAMALAKLYPGKIIWEVDKNLIGSDAVIAALRQGADALKASAEGVQAFDTFETQIPAL